MTYPQFDALVIGSGPNGLAAAITLAEQGRSVLVLEARPVLGGALATEELTLPGFRHDTFSAVHPAAIASPVFARMPLERYGLRWVHPPVAMAHPLPGGVAAALYQDIERTAENLDLLAPGDGWRWQQVMTPYLRHFDAVRNVILGPFPPVQHGLRLLAALGIEGTLEAARLLLLPATALAAELFTSEGAAAWLYGSALHGDIPLEGAGSAVTAFYLNVLGHGCGWPSPAGGAGNLAAALVGYLHALGGQTRTAAPVEHIFIERNRVQGVVLAGGEVLRARLVVGDLTPHGLLRLVGDDLPASYSTRLQRYRYAEPAFKLDWALSGPIPWEAAEARQAGTVHVGGTPATMHAALGQLRAGQLPEQPFILLGQQSLADPTRAPAGQHTGWAYTHVPAGLDWSGRREPLIEQLSERIEAHIERFAPGFRQRILARHVLAPPDLERQNRNLVGGDVGSGSYALDQLVFRPVPALEPYSTPITGLYIGSAATFPGAAVHGVAGAAAARLALRNDQVRRFWPR